MNSFSKYSKTVNWCSSATTWHIRIYQTVATVYGWFFFAVSWRSA